MKINAAHIILLILAALTGLILLVVLRTEPQGAVAAFPDSNFKATNLQNAAPADKEDTFLAEVHDRQRNAPPPDPTVAPLPPVDKDQTLVPAIEIETNEMDFGLIDRKETAHRPLKVRNTGRAPLKIHNIKTSCLCTQGHIAPEQSTILPGNEAVIDVTVNPLRLIGFVSTKTLTISSNDPLRPMIQVNVSARVDPEYKIEPEMLDLGEVERGEIKSATVRITQLQEEPFEVKDVNAVGMQGAATPVNDISVAFAQAPENTWKSPGRREWEITVSTTPNAMPGQLQRNVFIVTDLSRLPTMNFMVRANIVASITIEPAYPLPLVLKKNEITGKIDPATAHVRAEQTVSVDNLEYNKDRLVVVAKPGVNAQVYDIEVSLAPGLPPGRVEEEVRFTVRTGERTRQERIVVRSFVSPS